MTKFHIHPDIRKASTLPTSFYLDQAVFEESKEKIFAKSWQFATDLSSVEKAGSAQPFEFVPGFLPEPLVAVRDRKDSLRCLTNVCTHRGNLVVTKPGEFRVLSCGYHGRCFGLDGQFRAMPEFDGVEGFPSEADHLKRIRHEEWGSFLFAGLDPKHDFSATRKALDERLSFLPLKNMRYAADESQDYETKAHWALYCDNFLEGFHIPFVHPALNAALEKDNYEYHLFETGNLQLGMAGEGQPHFDLPVGHPDFGKKIYAFYFWLFPNLMINVYPWGISMNIVLPVNKDKTIIRYRTYYFKGHSGNKEVNRIDETEYEDQEVVESVQRGLRTRFYTSGRFSPKHERGVHHFHRLIADCF